MYCMYVFTARANILIICCLLLLSGYITAADDTSLSINTTPAGADLIFNETLTGTTPATIIGLSAGIYPLFLAFPGYEDYKTEIEVLTDTQYAVYITMNPVETTSDGETASETDSTSMYSYNSITEMSTTEIIYSGYVYPYGGPTVIIVNPDPVTQDSAPGSSETESEADTGTGIETHSSSSDESEPSTEGIESETESSAGEDEDVVSEESTSTTGPGIVTSVPTVRQGMGSSNDDETEGSTSSISTHIQMPTRIPTEIPTRPIRRTDGYEIQPDTIKPWIKDENPIPTIIPTHFVPKDISKTNPSEIKNQMKNGGSIQIQSNTPGAEVYIDGIKKGTTPITVEGLSAGTHQVQVGKPGYQQFSTDLMINQGSQVKKPQNMQVNLKPQMKR